MLGIACDTKKELKGLVGQNIDHLVIETSMFGLEYKSDMQNMAVVVSKQPDKVRKSFAQITVVNDILTKVL